MNNFLNKPWLVLSAGALIVGGIVFAQNFKPGSTVFAGNTAVMESAGLNTGVDMSALKHLDETFASLSEAASQAAVFITSDTSDANGNDAMKQLQGGKSGSGFIYRSNGWIVTNDHVVSGLDKVKVVLADGREMIGKVTHANDPQLDLAVVKVDADNLPSLDLGDSSKIRVGQFVLAVGAPFGLEDTVTIGHISALGRPGMIPDPQTGQYRAYSGLIQTDASVNPGNSGGPLITIDGDVVGVNSAINSPSGTNAGIAFAIPSNVVRVVADEMISTGKFDRGMMGVDPRDLKPFEKKKMNLPGGAFAKSIEANTPASQAGMKTGDIITKIDDLAISGEIDLRVAMYKHSPNETVTVTYLRDGRPQSASVKLNAPKFSTAPQQKQINPFADDQKPFLDIPDNPNAPESQDSQPKARGSKPVLGIGIQQINPTARQQFGLPEGVNGVVVTNVSEGSFAQKVNLAVGDVITAINNKPMNTVSDLTEAMASVQWGSQISVKFARFKNGGRSEYTVTVPFK